MTSKGPFTFLPLGAIIQSLKIGSQNIVQNFPTPALYKSHNAPYFGETIGRVANRISSAKINKINGGSYSLAANNGPNTLHGGLKGWGKQEWEGPMEKENGWIEFSYLSPDGDEGFPGEVEARVWYRDASKDGVSVLEVEYEAWIVSGAEETAVAMTNHSYFNLAGAPDVPTVEGTECNLSTNKYQAVDSDAIPKGPIVPYPGIEANQTFTLGAKDPDVDHCFVLNDDAKSIPVDTRSLPIQRLAKFYHPKTKIHFEVHSTEPAFQFYTGRYIDVPAAEGVPARGPRSGFCVEPSRYINAVNVDEWKGMVVLKKGEKFGSKIVYKGWQD